MRHLPKEYVWTPLMIVAIFLLGSAPHLGRAQTVTGRVLAGESDTPVQGAVVMLLTPRGKRVRTTQSDSLGAYSITAPQPAHYTIRARRVGYNSSQQGPFTLSLRDTLSLHLRIQPKPVAMEEVTVSARVKQRLQNVGYYERKEMTAGTFISRKEIDRMNPTVLSEVIRNVSSMIVKGGANSRAVRGTRGWVETAGRTTIRGEPCVPSIAIDGQLIRRGGNLKPQRSTRLNELVSPSNVRAMEVYPRGSSAPAQFGGTDSPCGAIVIWTKQK